MTAAKSGALGAALIGAIAGALAGSFVTMALRPSTGSTETSPATVDLDERVLARAIASANEPLREELRQLRASLARARAVPGAEVAGTTADGESRAAAPERPGRVTARAEAALWRGTRASGDDVRGGVELTPKPDRARLRRVRDFDDNSLTRRRYLFSS